MAIEIRVHNIFSARVDRARLRRIARQVLNAEKNSRAASPRRPVDVGLTVYVTTDSEIRALNKKFHATNAATDVLSFPSRQLGDPSPLRLYLGDIVISYDRARVQAREANWRIADELALLVVHGVLHLVGHDDLTPRARAKMWKRQEELLGRASR